MRLVLDENIHPRIGDIFREKFNSQFKSNSTTIQIITIPELFYSGITDVEILQNLQNDDVLLSFDISQQRNKKEWEVAQALKNKVVYYRPKTNISIFEQCRLLFASLHDISNHDFSKEPLKVIRRSQIRDRYLISV
ncbi:hypothetical protein EP331_15625 [bacterium]|nr:MAG: hypothetical protein EP331_15625 [bacterium]